MENLFFVNAKFAAVASGPIKILFFIAPSATAAHYELHRKNHSNFITLKSQ